MGVLRRVTGPHTLVTIAGVVTILAIGGGTAGACKLALDCRGLFTPGVRDADPPPVVAPGSGSFTRGFAERAVVRGLVEPTDFAFLPDGRILVAERRGLVWMVVGQRMGRAPVLDLRGGVSTYQLRGLITIAVDPAFPQRPYIYVLRTLATGRAEAAPTTARVSRFTLAGAVARRSSEVVVLGRVAGSRSCLELPATADCLPADSQHIGGQIRFADGTLFVSTGDGGGARSNGYDEISGHAQNVDSLGGKILRITRTGAGIPSNPYWNGNSKANRSKVWARGLRNPFRVSVRPGSDDVYVADLGNRQFDELSIAGRGDNLGWPCYEGTARFDPWAGADVCTALYAQGAAAVQSPVAEFRQNEARTLVGGDFYRGRAYPARYRGAYFFADFIYGWMKVLRFAEDGRPLAPTPEPFGTGLSGPVAVHEGPDGRLYYLSYVKGQLRRVDYRG